MDYLDNNGPVTQFQDITITVSKLTIHHLKQFCNKNDTHSRSLVLHFYIKKISFTTLSDVQIIKLQENIKLDDVSELFKKPADKDEVKKCNRLPSFLCIIKYEYIHI